MLRIHAACRDLRWAVGEHLYANRDYRPGLKKVVGIQYNCTFQSAGSDPPQVKRDIKIQALAGFKLACGRHNFHPADGLNLDRQVIMHVACGIMQHLQPFSACRVFNAYGAICRIGSTTKLHIAILIENPAIRVQDSLERVQTGIVVPRYFVPLDYEAAVGFVVIVEDTTA